MAPRQADPWTPEVIDTWLGIFRDTVIVILAAFMLVYETVFAPSVNAYIVGAGLTLAGVPPALRIDTGRRRRNGNGNGNGNGTDDPSNGDKRR